MVLMRLGVLRPSNTVLLTANGFPMSRRFLSLGRTFSTFTVLTRSQRLLEHRSKDSRLALETNRYSST